MKWVDTKSREVDTKSREVDTSEKFFTSRAPLSHCHYYFCCCALESEVPQRLLFNGFEKQGWGVPNKGPVELLLLEKGPIEWVLKRDEDL